MRFGLEEHIITKLSEVFEANSKVDKALIFGSRAKGNYRPDSDIDIAIKGADIALDDILKMQLAFEEKGINFKIDLVHYETIKEKELIGHIDRVGIEIYSRWKKYKLGDLIEIKHGFAFKGEMITDEPTNNILVTPGNFHIGGGFKKSKYKYFNGEVPDDYILKQGDVIVTMTDLSQGTDTLGYSAKVPKQQGVNFLHNQRIGLVQFTTDKTDIDFIYWLMRTKDYQSFIANSASGTSIMHTAPTRIKEYSFSLPPISEQIIISEVLNSLDDKIDLLDRQNKTLEQLAETLFRQWFVEEARGNSKIGELGDVIELVYGKGLKEEERTGEGYPVVGSSGVVGYHSEFLVEGPGIVIGRKGTLGKVTYLYGNFFPIDTTYFVKSKKNSTGLYFEYFLLKTMNFEELNSDSAVPGLNRDLALGTEIAIPPNERIAEFNGYCSSLFEKMKFNNDQIRTLIRLRDGLLPKLMSGEIRIDLEDSRLTKPVKSQN